MSINDLENFVSLLIHGQNTETNPCNIKKPQWWPEHIKFHYPLTRKDNEIPEKWTKVLLLLVLRCYLNPNNDDKVVGGKDFEDHGKRKILLDKNGDYPKKKKHKKDYFSPAKLLIDEVESLKKITQPKRITRPSFDIENLEEEKSLFPKKQAASEEPENNNYVVQSSPCAQNSTETPKHSTIILEKSQIDQILQKKNNIPSENVTPKDSANKGNPFLKNNEKLHTDDGSRNNNKPSKNTGSPSEVVLRSTKKSAHPKQEEPPTKNASPKADVLLKNKTSRKTGPFSENPDSKTKSNFLNGKKKSLEEFSIHNAESGLKKPPRGQITPSENLTLKGKTKSRPPQKNAEDTLPSNHQIDQVNQVPTKNPKGKNERNSSSREEKDSIAQKNRSSLVEEDIDPIVIDSDSEVEDSIPNYTKPTPMDSFINNNANVSKKILLASMEQILAEKSPIEDLFTCTIVEENNFEIQEKSQKAPLKTPTKSMATNTSEESINILEEQEEIIDLTFDDDETANVSSAEIGKSTPLNVLKSLPLNLNKIVQIQNKVITPSVSIKNLSNSSQINLNEFKIIINSNLDKRKKNNLGGLNVFSKPKALPVGVLTNSQNDENSPEDINTNVKTVLVKKKNNVKSKTNGLSSKQQTTKTNKKHQAIKIKIGPMFTTKKKLSSINKRPKFELSRYLKTASIQAAELRFTPKVVLNDMCETSTKTLKSNPLIHDVKKQNYFNYLNLTDKRDDQKTKVYFPQKSLTNVKPNLLKIPLTSALGLKLMKNHKNKCFTKKCEKELSQTYINTCCNNLVNYEPRDSRRKGLRNIAKENYNESYLQESMAPIGLTNCPNTCSKYPNETSENLTKKTAEAKVSEPIGVRREGLRNITKENNEFTLQQNMAIGLDTSSNQSSKNSNKNLETSSEAKICTKVLARDDVSNKTELTSKSDAIARSELSVKANVNGKDISVKNSAIANSGPVSDDSADLFKNNAMENSELSSKNSANRISEISSQNSSSDNLALSSKNNVITNSKSKLKTSAQTSSELSAKNTVDTNSETAFKYSADTNLELISNASVSTSSELSVKQIAKTNSELRCSLNDSANTCQELLIKTRSRTNSKLSFISSDSTNSDLVLRISSDNETNSSDSEDDVSSTVLRKNKVDNCYYSKFPVVVLERFI